MAACSTKSTPRNDRAPLSPWERGLSPRPPLHSCHHRLGAFQAHQFQLEKQQHQQRLADDENVAELALETFFPADGASAAYLRQLAQG